MLCKRQEKYIEIVKEQFLNYFDSKGDILTEKFDEFVGKMLKELKPLWTTPKSSVYPSHLTRFITNLKIKKVIAKLKEKESSKTQLSVTGHSEQEHSDIEDSSLHAIPSSTEGNIEEYAAGPCISHGALYSIAINYGHDSDESINYEELPLENIEDRMISQSFAMSHTSRMGYEIDSANNDLSAAVVNFDDDITMNFESTHNMLAPPKPAVTQNPQQQIISLEEFPTEEEELQELNNISAHDSDSSWMDFLSKKYNNAEKEMEQERNSCDYDVTCPMDISLSIDFGESFSMTDLGKTDEEIDDTVIGGMSQIFMENNQLFLRETSSFEHVSLDETIFDED
ncbi:unnamed protein product [Chironomus riparius]|uniref:Uncharacterized protein n=1 Tax=Chironomus riparius TaxID=315576 RepID=A0A9N9WMC4_9DIPT|nr:unnamed protein product [Chironomus riparius]